MAASLPLSAPWMYADEAAGVSSTVNNQLPVQVHPREWMSPIAAMDSEWAPLMDAAPMQPRKIKFSKFETALNDLRAMTSSVVGTPDSIRYYYTHVPFEVLEEKLGGFNPMRNGKPTGTAMKLLSGVPAPLGGKGYELKQAGLMYFTPHIAGVRKSRNRTTANGIKLLDLWAKHHRAFEPFCAAFMPMKARREILTDCVDFSLEIMPPAFAKAIEANKAKVEILMEKLRLRDAKAQADMARRSQMQAPKVPNYMGQLGGALSPLFGAENQLLGQQPLQDQYSLTMAKMLQDQQNVTLSSFAGAQAQNIRSNTLAAMQAEMKEAERKMEVEKHKHLYETMVEYQRHTADMLHKAAAIPLSAILKTYK